ncbi:MAG: aminotransferase [Isosphaeraceae bacterium]|nr:MAG: aminotransferase [Isosphaeraceae bacterium]
MINPSLSALARRTGDSPISDLMARALACPDLISLAAGFVDNDTLPRERTHAAVATILKHPTEGNRALQYGTTRGDTSLRRILAELVAPSQNWSGDQIEALADRIIVTNGSQQLLYLVAESLLDPGDIVLVESPTYFVFLGLLQSRGARVIGVDIDEGGMRLDVLEQRLAEQEAAGQLDRVKLIYTITEHSNPSGLSLDADRRPALVRIAQEWSRSHRIYILEDAAYRGLHYEGPEPPTLWSHDHAGTTVIHARTFSKTFSPGLKVGFGILPTELLGPILALKGNHDFGSAHFSQQLMERVLKDGAYTAHVSGLRQIYRRKRDVLLDALAEHFAPWRGEVEWTHPQGGLYVWLTLPPDLDTGRDSAYFARCLEEGVLYVPGAYCFAGEPVAPPSHHARLTFGVTSPEGLREGVRRMAQALAQVRKTSGPILTPRLEVTAPTRT